MRIIYIFYTIILGLEASNFQLYCIGWTQRETTALRNNYQAGYISLP